MGRLVAVFAIFAATLSLSAPLRAAERVGVLAEALRLGEFVQIMVTEGKEYGAGLDRDFLNGEGGTYFAERVARIHDGARMADTLETALAETMTQAQIDTSIAFFQTDGGRRAMDLEVSARRAFMDEAVEDAARDAVQLRKKAADSTYDGVDRFVQANDLVELNVRGALSSNYNFYRGMVAGGAYQMSERQMREAVFRDAEEIRDDTMNWIYGYLLVAYGPLEPETLEAYIAYSESPAGQALNAALFKGYDKVFDVISFELGEAVANAMQSADL